MIKFPTAAGSSPADILRKLSNVYGEANVVSLCRVQYCQKLFKEGCTSVDNDEREGRLSDTIDETVRCVRAHLVEN